MQSGITGHVNPKEWRWVFIVSILLVGLAFIPFLWVVMNNNTESNWQFMGALHSHAEASAYLSRIRQGMEGDILVRFMHTPEPHQSVILQPVYPLLGQVSRLAADNLSPILVFHVARVSVTVFMYMALYQLAATIWTRVRTRRVFFALVAVGSGLGWLSLVLGGASIPIDLTYSHLSPFYSGLVSIHVPLTIACLALLGAIVIAALRPGVMTVPTVRNSGLVAFVLGIVLVLLYPEAYLLLVISVVLTVVFQWYFAKQVTNRELLWMMWTLVPALPFLIYNVLVLRSNVFVQEWIQQRSSQVVDPLQLLLSLGILLLIGLPSIYRAIRRFESDGDRYMIIWLLVSCIGALLPIDIRIHFLVGVMIPVAYFATRSIEDVWLQYFQRRYRTITFALVVVLVMISNLVALLTPLIPIASQNSLDSQGLIASRDYGVALNWLEQRVTATDVVLASPEISTWIPLWLGTYTVAGHPHETMDSRMKFDTVADLYQRDNDADCDDALRRLDGFNGRYTINYVIYGLQERQYGDAACLRDLTFVASFGDVEIYQVSTIFPR